MSLLTAENEHPGLADIKLATSHHPNLIDDVSYILPLAFL